MLSWSAGKSTILQHRSESRFVSSNSTVPPESLADRTMAKEGGFGLVDGTISDAKGLDRQTP